MVMTNWLQMLLAMLAATALYDLVKHLYKYLASLDNKTGKEPIGYAELQKDGSLKEYIFDNNYHRDRKN